MASRSVANAPTDNDIEATLHAEIHRLPDLFRATVVLCDLEGLSTDEAAHRLGIPVGTARSRLARGREKLRSRLIRLGIAPAAITAITSQTASAIVHLPAGLAEATLKTAIAFAKVGTVSAPLSLLVRGEYRIMKIKAWTSIVMATGLVTGTGAIIGQTSGKGPGAVSKSDVKTKAPVNVEVPKQAIPRPKNSDVEALRGEWKVVSVKQNGVVSDKTELADASFTFLDSGLLSIAPLTPGVFDYWFTLSADSEPREMVLSDAHKPSSNDKKRWIYEVAHDTLKVAFSPVPGVRLSRFDQVDREHPVVLVELTRFSPRFAPGKLADDLARLQGRWAATKVFQDGKELPDLTTDKIVSMLIEGDVLTNVGADGKAMSRYRFAVDVRSEPRTIRLFPIREGKPATKDSPTVIVAIYSLEGDTLRLAYDAGNANRKPKSFEDFGTPGGPSLYTYEFVRQSPPPKPNPPETSRVATKPTSVADDIARLQGRWEWGAGLQRRWTVKRSPDGEVLPPPSMHSATVHFKGDEVDLHIPSQSSPDIHYRFEIDPKAEPGTLHLTPIAPSSGEPIWWIYEFDKVGRLRLALPVGETPHRPSSFDPSSENQVDVHLFYRQDAPQSAAKPQEVQTPTKPIAKSASDLDLDRMQGRWKTGRVVVNGREELDSNCSKHGDDRGWRQARFCSAQRQDEVDDPSSR